MVYSRYIILLFLVYHLITLADSLDLTNQHQVYDVSEDSEEVTHSSFECCRYVESTDVNFTPRHDIVKGEVGEDVELVWIYDYHSDVLVLNFYNDRNEMQTNMMVWAENQQIFSNEYDNRLNIDVTSHGDRVEITLIIHVTRLEDYYHNYYCQLFTVDHHRETSGIHLSLDISGNDFIWLDTNRTMTGFYGDEVKLIWKYKTTQQIDKIYITSSKTTSLKQDFIASWTSGGSSETKDGIHFKVTFQHLKQENTGMIILTLTKASPVVFDRQYDCEVTISNLKYTQSKDLQSFRLPFENFVFCSTEMEYRPVTEVVTGAIGEDVKLVWIYRYSFPVRSIRFSNNRQERTDMVHWENNSSVVEGEYENRVRLIVDQTSNKDQVEITLIIQNTRVIDYNYTYYSYIVADDFKTKFSGIFLQYINVDV